MYYSLKDNLNKIKDVMKDLEVDFYNKDKELQEQSLKFTSVDKIINDTIKEDDYKIKINIGGKIFTLRLSQLVTHKDTLFYFIIFNYVKTHEFPKEIFIDRNYTYFHVIIEYLIFNSISLCKYNAQDRQEIKKEFEFYGISLKKNSDFVLVKGIDFGFGDVSSIEVLNYDDAVKKAKEWVISSDRCATLSGNTLRLKNLKLTEPNKSGFHDSSSSFVHGKSLDLLSDEKNDIIQIDGIDLWGGDVRNFKTNFEDAIKSIEEWVINSEQCATFVDNTLYLKHLSKSNPKTNTNYHHKCISFVYGAPI